MSTQNSRFWVTGGSRVGLGMAPTNVTLAKLNLRLRLEHGAHCRAALLDQVDPKRQTPLGHRDRNDGTGQRHHP